MKEIFPGVYRFSKGKNSRAHSYLLVRKQGNLLICQTNQGSSIIDFLDEVEQLGGIAQQFVAHRHDASTGELHQLLYERFGCTLSYHERHRKQIEKKTECPVFEFGDEGLELGGDFHAIDIGRTVFHWSDRGKHFLIPNHAVRRHDEEWNIHMDPLLDLPSQLARLLELPVDYLLPGHTSPSDEEFHTFTDRSLKAYHQAVRERLTPVEKSTYVRLRLGERVEKGQLEPGLPRLFSNFNTPHLKTLIEELGLFAIHQMPGGATGKIDILLNSLELADIFFSFYFRREFGPKHKFWDLLRQHAEEGGTLFICDARRKLNPRWIAGGHPFPEIAVWGDPTEDPGNELTICEGHPAKGDAPGEARFESSLYDGGSLEPGDGGSVLARNASGRPVAVAGEVGKGRVVFSCFFFHPLRDPALGAKRQFLQGIFRWLASPIETRDADDR